MTSKDLQFSTGNSTYYSIMAYTGEESKNEWIYVYVYKHTHMSIHGHHQMVNTKIRLILFFAAKDGEVSKKDGYKDLYPKMDTVSKNKMGN